MLVAWLVAAWLVAGCGSSKPAGVSAASYVKSVCTAVNSWASSIEAKSGALNVSKITNAVQGKTALKNFFTSAVSDTDTAVSKLQAAGTPNISNGKTIATGLVSSFDQIGTALKKGATQAAALPVTSPTAFKTAGTALGTSVQKALNDVGASLSSLKSSALEKAAASEPACKSTS